MKLMKLMTFEDALKAMDKISETTAVASNATERVVVDMVGKAIGVNARGKTAVRKTTCGKFAVVSTVPRKDESLRLIKTFADGEHARRYNFAIHGDKL